VQSKELLFLVSQWNGSLSYNKSGYPYEELPKQERYVLCWFIEIYLYHANAQLMFLSHQVGLPYIVEILYFITT
jgi:hypothetical protein